MRGLFHQIQFFHPNKIISRLTTKKVLKIIPYKISVGSELFKSIWNPGMVGDNLLSYI
jgi:hypothetical protein